VIREKISLPVVRVYDLYYDACQGFDLLCFLWWQFAVMHPSQDLFGTLAETPSAAV
jgi:hypothetical protein